MVRWKVLVSMFLMILKIFGDGSRKVPQIWEGSGQNLDFHQISRNSRFSSILLISLRDLRNFPGTVPENFQYHQKHRNQSFPMHQKLLESVQYRKSYNISNIDTIWIFREIWFFFYTNVNDLPGTGDLLHKSTLLIAR